jgi:hypothetical protein
MEAPLKTNRYADIDLSNPSTISNFTISLTNFTALIFFKAFSSLYLEKYFFHQLRKDILEVFEKTEDIPHLREPTFSLVHIWAPHPPTLFDSNGNWPKVIYHIWEKGYVGQLIFVTKKLRILIEKLITSSEIPPIIILQSDHGIRFGGKKTPLFFKAHMGILNAYYFPGKEKHGLYRKITPVNSFRVLFNLYFGTRYKLLEDKSLFSELSSPLEFIRIADEDK